MRITFPIYDNDSSINDFPLGVAYLISMLQKNGVPDEDIDVFNMDVYHHTDEQMFEYLDKGNFDVVAIGMIAGYWQFIQLKRMFVAIDRLKRRPVVVLGGFMVTPEPEYFMRKFKAEYVVLGEAELSFPMVIDCIANGSSPAEIPGLAYWEGKKIKINARQKPISDLDTIPFPAWDKFPIENYVGKVRLPGLRSNRNMPVLTSRGCPYTCAFCYRLEKGYRIRSMDNIIEEVKILISKYNLNSICFRDELLMVSEKRTVEFAERMIKEDLGIKFDIDGRLRVAKRAPYVLKLLAKAGCVYVNYGVESLDQDVLNNMNKLQTVEEIYDGIKATREAGLHSGLNVIFGNVGDDRETAQKTVNFLKEFDTYAEMRTLKPVTPYPGSPLYDLAKRKGLIKGCKDFYENKHLNSDHLTANFTDLSDEEFYDVLLDCNKELIRDYYKAKEEDQIRAHELLYLEGDTSFRGVRH